MSQKMEHKDYIVSYDTLMRYYILKYYFKYFESVETEQQLETIIAEEQELIDDLIQRYTTNQLLEAILEYRQLINTRYEVRDLDKEEDIYYIEYFTDTAEELKKEYKYYNDGEGLDEYDTFFIRINDGEISELYAMYNTVPWLWKQVDRIF